LPLSIVAHRPVAKQWLCKQRPFLRNNQVNKFPLSCSSFLILQQLKATIEELCFLRVPCRGVIKRSQLSFETPACQTMNLGVEELMHRNYWAQFRELKVWLWKDFICAAVQWYLACVIQWDCYSSCIKIRCQESANGTCI
jgi:hypothetical protein